VESIAFSGADQATRYRERLAPIAELLGSLSW